MASHDERSRMSYADAVAVINRPTNPCVSHLIDNQDGTYSVISHIVCHWCTFCDDQGDCRCVEAPIAVPYREASDAESP